MAGCFLGGRRDGHRHFSFHRDTLWSSPVGWTFEAAAAALFAPVAQWIEQWFPVPCAGVRFPSGVLHGVGMTCVFDS